MLGFTDFGNTGIFLKIQIPNLYKMYRERPLATRVAIEHDTVMYRLFYFSLNLSSKGVSRLHDKNGTSFSVMWTVRWELNVYKLKYRQN